MDNVSLMLPKESVSEGSGNDRLYGGEGNDTIVGGAGNDFIVGDDKTEYKLTPISAVLMQVILLPQIKVLRYQEKYRWNCKF